jgi:hypothetical protein
MKLEKGKVYRYKEEGEDIDFIFTPIEDWKEGNGAKKKIIKAKVLKDNSDDGLDWTGKSTYFSEIDLPSVTKVPKHMIVIELLKEIIL